jgi:hypothetical protein
LLLEYAGVGYKAYANDGQYVFHGGVRRRSAVESRYVFTWSGRRRVSFFAASVLTRFIICSLLIITENILANGPPRDEDWWENEDSDDGSEDSASLEEGSKKQLHTETAVQPGTEKRFRNCGLETFLRVQQAWRARDPRLIMQSRSPSPKVKRDLVKALSGCRQFDLPRRLPLKDLIGAYTEVWNGDASE